MLAINPAKAFIDTILAVVMCMVSAMATFLVASLMIIVTIILIGSLMDAQEINHIDRYKSSPKAIG